MSCFVEELSKEKAALLRGKARRLLEERLGVGLLDLAAALIADGIVEAAYEVGFSAGWAGALELTPAEAAEAKKAAP